MSHRVSRDSIESIVGTTRSKTAHYARIVSTESMVYILHSKECLDSEADLRECEFSLALDRGVFGPVWEDKLDQPVKVIIRDGFLLPAG